jgi:uncharacterized protein
MVELGYVASVLIGISLGLIGGGGSILTVPVLVYLFSINPVLSTSYSLFVVGSTSLVGAINRRSLVNIKVALLFGASSILTVFAIRKWVLPLIPDQLFKLGSFEMTKSVLTMLLFALLMIMAAVAMIRNKNDKKDVFQSGDPINYGILSLYGVLIGVATGMLGAGGGFLLIPALVLFVGMPMKQAVGTSLLIIALNSLIGFAGDIGHFPIDWYFLLKISAIAIVGIFIGEIISRKIDGDKLKKGFGWFVLAMGLYILIIQFIDS